MREYLKIFAVLTAICTFAPWSAWGGGKCRPHSCKMDEDFCELLSTDGITERSSGGNGKNILTGRLCFHCNINVWGFGIGDDDCNFNTFVATEDGNLFQCIDDAGIDNTWNNIDFKTLKPCKKSKLTKTGVDHSTCVVSGGDGDPLVLPTVVTAPCPVCTCDDGYEEKDGTECVQKKTNPDPAPDPTPDPASQCDETTGAVLNSSGSCECVDPNTMTLNGDGLTCSCNEADTQYDMTVGQCVSTAEAVCKNSGGTWDASAGTCSCDAENTEENPNSNLTECKCKDDYEWKDPANKSSGCKLSDAAKKQQKDFDTRKAECERWGGEWSGDPLDGTTWACDCAQSTKPGVVQNSKDACKCDVPTYFEDSPYECKEDTSQNRKHNCEEAKSLGENVYWKEQPYRGETIGTCECRAGDQYYYNTAEKRCKPKFGNQSPGGGGTGIGTMTTPSVPDVSAQMTKINDAVQQLRTVSGNFKKSHWKNASGGFNTARLASDSVAGVVLGTLGGVITSNVVKKNQVKSGFENMRCIVGGQTVAEFGDQFQVGIR